MIYMFIITFTAKTIQQTTHSTLATVLGAFEGKGRPGEHDGKLPRFFLYCCPQ